MNHWVNNVFRLIPFIAILSLIAVIPTVIFRKKMELPVFIALLITELAVFAVGCVIALLLFLVFN